MLTDYANKVMDYEYNMFMSVMNVSVSKHLWDEHFTVLWANDYFYELIGYEKEEYTALFHNHVDEYFKDDPGAVAAMGEIIMAAYGLKEQGYEFECHCGHDGNCRCPCGQSGEGEGLLKENSTFQPASAWAY